MEGGMMANYRAAGLQSRLQARAEAAATPRAKQVWTRVAIVHQLVGRQRLNPEAVKDIAFLLWLRESGRLGGPGDGAADPTTVTIPVAVGGRLAHWLPARCRKCGRFVAGRFPGFCAGCSAVHCPYCLLPDGCEHLLTVVSKGAVSPPLVDPTSLPMLKRPGRGAWEPSADELRSLFGRHYLLLLAYRDGLDVPPNLGRLTERLLAMVDYPICFVARDSDVRGGTGRAACYFVWRSDVARRRIGQDVAELRRRFERLASVISHGRPMRPSTLDSIGRRQRQGRLRSVPPDVLPVRCGTEQHRVSLPSRGPIVLLDHPDREYVEAALAGRDGVEGCLLALRYVRGRAGYNSYGWWKWSTHVAPSFGPSGGTIRDCLKEFDQRRKLRRLLREVDLG
jgi:hypothetical protein